MAAAAEAVVDVVQQLDQVLDDRDQHVGLLAVGRGLRPPEEPADHPDYRFTLANERTLLAWLRTGLALVAGGVAVATYAPDLGVRWGSAAVALALVLVGLGSVAAGYRRWRSNEAAI